MADEDDSIRALLEGAVAGDDTAPPAADIPEIDAPAVDPPAETPPADGRQRDELGRFAPKADEKEAPRSRRPTG